MIEFPHWTEGKLPDEISSRIIADSAAPAGHRITTFELKYPRYMHAELMTHALLNKNSASSRAIPYPKLRKQVVEAPAGPIVWPANQPGMQGGADLTDADVALAQSSWLKASKLAVSWADNLAWYDAQNDRVLNPKDEKDRARAEFLGLTSEPLHKSIPNRLIEPWMFITVTCTGTDWEGFFNQRSSHRTKLVLPEFGKLAAQMEDLMDASRPAFLEEGDWHTPYIFPEEYVDLPYLDTVRLSAARCARTSYMTHDGRRDNQEDFRLYGDLCAPGDGPQHASPLAHVATPAPWNEYVARIDPADYGLEKIALREGVHEMRVPIVGSARGFMQLRHVVLGW